MYQVFIDGAEGTTGLKIHEYFKRRDDIKVLTIDEDKRKDIDERLKYIKKADISFLCLPDAAAKEIAAAAPSDARILDTSTAHRTDDLWAYGMPELSEEQREKIKGSSRVAVPGCHATGTILLIAPLVKSEVVRDDYPFSVYSLTGYSGGGKKMIADYEGYDGVKAPSMYALSQSHKHLPEIMKMTGLRYKPSFMPVVGHYFSGMEVSIPVNGAYLENGMKKADIAELYKEYYNNSIMVNVCDSVDDKGFIYADRLKGSNMLNICVDGNDDNILLTATYDNLGKGASGAAVQNMNIMLGISEDKGLK